MFEPLTSLSPIRNQTLEQGFVMAAVNKMTSDVRNGLKFGKMNKDV